jgi:hypothetical protein
MKRAVVACRMCLAEGVRGVSLQPPPLIGLLRLEVKSRISLTKYSSSPSMSSGGGGSLGRRLTIGSMRAGVSFTTLKTDGDSAWDLATEGSTHFGRLVFQLGKGLANGGIASERAGWC